MSKLDKLKAMITDDATVALLGMESVNKIKDKIKELEGVRMNTKEALVYQLEQENKTLKSTLEKVIKKIDSIMVNENNNSDIYELGIMVSEMKSKFFNNY